MSLIYGQDEPTQAPFLSDAKKFDLIKSFYGIQSGQLINLSGYEDINFRLTNIAPDDVVDDVVVKISNPIEARDSRHLDLQNDICQTLNNQGIPAPELVPMTDGKMWAYINVQTEQLPIRMFKTLPGDVLEKFEIDEGFLIKIGSMISQMHQVFDERQYETSHLPFISADNFDCFFREIEILSSRKMLDEDKSNLAIRFLKDYKENIYNRRDSLDVGLIHSDLNETNILICPDDNNELQISGVLDFGDVHVSYRGCDIAACALYLYLCDSKLSLQTIISRLVKGYEMNKQFNDRHLLMYCIRARLVCSLIYGLRTNRLSVRPDNPDYILKTQSNGWKVLKELSDMKGSD
ncbi:unnamed protein product [Auanema sp. JU1783]|nr:unnamed protein product [Auanema sp. JU1783]